jgi:hypothetical protein
MIETTQRIIVISNERGEGREGVGGTNPAIKRHFELQIKTLQNAPRRDADDKLERLLQPKQTKERSNAHGGHTKRLVTEEIEMFKVVFCIWCVQK